MKNKKMLICLIVILLFLIFIGYKFVMLQKYKIDNISIDNESIFNETMNIKYNNSNNITTFDDMSYLNYFSDYVHKENTDLKVKYNDNNDVVSFYNIVKEKQYINILNMNSFELYSDGEKNNINFNTEHYMQKHLDKNNINDDVDLLNYLKNNYYFKNNIFTCTKTMRNNYIFNSLISVVFPEFSSITLIDGSLKGYIVNTTSPAKVKEIHLLHDNDQYIITLSGEEITNIDFINNLLKSISFK